jgi:hypothetical protein
MHVTRGGRDQRRDIYIRYGSIKYREVYRSVILMVAGSSSSVDAHKLTD